MITLVQRRKSKKNVYLHFNDGVYYTVNKLPIHKYQEALSICDNKENIDFLYMISTRTNDRDVVNSVPS